jgi:hypothetical protein
MFTKHKSAEDAIKDFQIGVQIVWFSDTWSKVGQLAFLRKKLRGGRGAARCAPTTI